MVEGVDAVRIEERLALTRPFAPPSRAALCVAALCLVLLFSNLGDTSLPSFDDAYHAQTAKEMMLRGDPITITYGGTPSFQSSPLCLWLMALAYMLFGVGEYAARLPSAILSMATVVLVYFFARKRWGEAAGVTAAFILATSSLFLRYSRHAMMEVPLTFFTTAALLCLLAARRNSRWYFGFGLATGLAILTKSGLGFLPLIIAFLYLLLSGRAGEIIRPVFLLSLLLAIAVAATWYIPAFLIHGELFVESHISQYLALHTFSGHHSDLGLWGPLYYLVRLPVQYLPWTILLLPALVWGLMEWRKRTAEPGLWLAVVVPFLILSFITSKYTRYLIPIFPPAALLIAATWSRAVSDVWKQRMQASLAWLSALAAVAVLILPISLSNDRNADIKQIAVSTRALTAELEPVANLGLDYYEYQNPLLFYGDRLFSQPVQQAELLWSEMEDGQNRTAISSEADYSKVLVVADAEIEITEEGRHGKLVLFQIHKLGEDDWAAEIEELLPLIPSSVVDGKLGCFKLPKKRLQPILIKTAGYKLLPNEDRAGRLVRMMVDRDVNYGLAWSHALDELQHFSPKLPILIPLAVTKHLVLFSLLPKTDANPDDEVGR